MALSGSFTGTSTNKYIQPKITWSATQNVTGNYSDVTAILTYSRTNSGYTTYGTWNGGITINGTRSAASKNITITQNSNTEAVRATTRVYHNPDGSKNIVISADGGISGIGFDSTYISATVTLNTIPREARITGASNFNDEENPTIEFNNPGGLDLILKLEAGGNDKLIIRDKVTKTSPYTFALTDTERRTLRQLCTSSTLPVRFTVGTYMNGTVTYWDWLDRTMTLVNHTPTLSPTVITTTATSLTGSSDVLIRHLSTATVTFNASARKEASITYKKVVCGGKTYTSTSDRLEIPNVASGTFTISATDSRGNTTTVPVTKSIIPYVIPTCNLSLKGELVGENAATVTVNVRGKYFKGSFGTRDNQLTVRYRYWKNGESASDNWTVMTVSSDGDGENAGYSATATITGLTYRDTCNVQVQMGDTVTTPPKVYDTKSVQITPVFDWGPDDFRFNVPVTASGGLYLGNSQYPTKSFQGGELLASAVLYNTNAGTAVYPINASVAVSDILTSNVAQASITNYIDEMIDYDSGTLRVNTKGIAGLVEATFEVSGKTNSACGGIWFGDGNRNPLPNGVTMAGVGGKGLLYDVRSNWYGGGSVTYFYNMDANDTGTYFYVNPTFQPYGSGDGTFTPMADGTGARLYIKVFAKRTVE